MPPWSLVPAPKQHFTREDKAQIKEKAMPADSRPIWKLLNRYANNEIFA